MTAFCQKQNFLRFFLFQTFYKQKIADCKTNLKLKFPIGLPQLFLKKIRKAKFDYFVLQKGITLRNCNFSVDF